MAGVGLFDLIMLSIRVKLNILLTCILNFYSLILVSERYKPPWGNINEWFYFTNINPINNGEEGSGTERGVMRGGEYGYWKQTAEGEEEIKSEEGRKIGYKKTLVFYQLNGSHPDGSDGVETDWMMYEYRLAVPDQQPPPPPKRKRQQLQLQLQLHTFIFIPSSSSSSSFLPKRKIIGGGYNRKTALPFYQPSLSHPLGAPVLKPNLIVQELITVANPPILTTHHHNMRVQLHTYSYLSLFFLFYSYSIYIYIYVHFLFVCLFVCCSWMSAVLFYAESLRVVMEDPLAQAQALRMMHQPQAQAQALIFHEYLSFTPLLLLLLIKPMMIISQLPVKLNVYKKNSLITHTARLLIFLTHSKINNNKNSNNPLMFMKCPPKFPIPTFKFFLRPEQMMHQPQPQPLPFQNISIPLMIIPHTKIMAPFCS